MSRLYSHCVVIHFAAHPPSMFWPKGVTAYSRAEWAGSLALAERSASRWRKEPYVEAIEILDARQCDAVLEGQEPRAGQLLQLRG